MALRKKSKSFAAGSFGAHALASAIGLGAAIALVASCGARTGLPVPEIVAGDTSKGGMMPEAGPDAFDAAPDVQEDVIPPPDECPEGGTKTFIYLITEEAHLLAYDPPLKTYHDIGVVNCPFGSMPFSMGVARNGTAYVVYQDGELYKVSTRDASCEALNFPINQQGFTTFGMGYSADTNDPGEQLYVAMINLVDGGVSKGLATIDTNALVLNYVGPFSDNPGNSLELAGTGDGRLFGYFIDSDNLGGTIAQIDKTNATILSEQFVPNTGTNNTDLAFSFWGGDFYVFTAEDLVPPTTVTRVSGTASDIETTIPFRVVGAGVSTCAPSQ